MSAESNYNPPAEQDERVAALAPVWTALQQIARANDQLERDLLLAQVTRLRRFRARPDVAEALARLGAAC